MSEAKNEKERADLALNRRLAFSASYARVCTASRNAAGAYAQALINARNIDKIVEARRVASIKEIADASRDHDATRGDLNAQAMAAALFGFDPVTTSEDQNADGTGMRGPFPMKPQLLMNPRA